MSRHIDADIALEIIDRYRNTTDENGKIIADAIIDIIKTITTAADAAEITHGRWIYADGDVGYSVYQCSECGKEITVDEEEKTYHYCPNCGAKMHEANDNV